MILTALARYEPPGGALPAGYARKATLGFQLTITDGGNGCRLESLYAENVDGKPGLSLKPVVVPDMTRSNNPPPLLACDNAGFVLGRPKPGPADDAERQQDVAAGKLASFAQLMRDYREESDDSDVDAYLRWVALGMPGLDDQITLLPSHAAKRLDLDLIGIAVEGSTSKGYLHDKPSARAFWARRAFAAKSGTAEKVCLVCGEARPVLDTLPQALAGRWIPGTDTAQVALVSANFPAAMRGASGAGLKSVPICASCGGRAVSAFNVLASDESHSYRLSESTSAIWWAVGGDATEAMLLLRRAQPEQVRTMLASVRSGSRAARPRGEFFLLLFSGNVARLVVRRWFTLQLSGLEANVARWFGDTEAPDSDHPYRTPAAMARSLGPYPIGERGDVAPEGSAAALLLAALTGESPSVEYLRPAIARTVAEVRRLDDDDGWRARQRSMDRLGVIRLILNRTATGKEQTMSAHLDESRDDPAYLSGRIFALCQGLQRAALGDVNSSIVDRYFARAVQHPASIDGALATLQMQHVASLQRKGSGGLAFTYQKRIEDLRSRMGDAPGRLGIKAQAAWIAGYFQQREANFQPKRDASENGNTHDDRADAVDENQEN